MKNNIQTPAQIYKDLFKTIHQAGIFKDAKRFTDATPKAKSEVILKAFSELKAPNKEVLSNFVTQYFDVKEEEESDYKSDNTISVEKHLHSLWAHLSREKDPIIEGDSLIPLPFSYIVPGGRFNEIYYWDSYFTMLGLKVSKKYDKIESMIDNFAYLIDTIGFIPNGNRTYFAGRSQPPFFACMISLLASIKGDAVHLKYLSALEKEYDFWMEGEKDLTPRKSASKRVVRVKKGMILNRYWDNFPTARDEMYPDDMELLQESGRTEEDLFRDIRAACESGWDFSSRWLKDVNDLTTIQTTSIIPIDLNCLLYNLEKTISIAYSLKNDDEKKAEFVEKAEQRKEAIQTLMWCKRDKCYFDYNFKAKKKSRVASLAITFPLFFKIADEAQALGIKKQIETKFLKIGGLVTSPFSSGQQWDSPNGWAPLQCVAIDALRNYGHDKLAAEITKRWLTLNEKVFKNTGKMMEKYNVEDDTLHAGGGEYEVQDGFGWTNGVYLYLAQK